MNISTRAQAGGGRNLIAGFVIHGRPGQGKAYLVRAVGPGLGSKEVVGCLPNPRLEVFSGQVTYRTNDNWREHDEASGFSLTETANAVQAFPLQPASEDAAILPVLSSGIYYAHVTSADARSGVALVEAYDGIGGDTNARILNLSTRGFAGPNEDILITGFVVGGAGSMRLLVRAIGPSLAQFGVAGVLASPRLTLFSGGTPIGSNTGWTADGYKNDLMVAGASVSAFPLVEMSADSAMLFEAQPGPYTIQVSGVAGTTGEALAEIYVLP